MLKRMLMGMFAVLAIAAIAATVVPADRAYVDKAIENSQGFSSQVWIPSSGSFDLIDDSGTIAMTGYKDVASYKAGKAKTGQLTVKLKLSDLTTFSALWTEVAGKVLADSKFTGGTLRNTVD